MRTIALLVLLAVSTPLIAQEGMYTGIGIGSFDYSESDPFLAPEPLAERVSAWKLYGGFEMNEHLAFEIRYGESEEIGTTTSFVDPFAGPISSTVDVDFQVTTVLGMGMLPFEWGTLLGGIGFFSSSSDADFSIVSECCGSARGSADLDDDGLAAMVGVEWRFGRLGTGIGVRLEYEWLDFENAKASTLGVGVSYRF